MLAPGAPKFRRRKANRPGEIVEAAMAVFAEKGFAAAKLDDIAERAGVSKGAIYLYFATKEDIFRAVVEQAIAPNIQVVKALAAAHPGPFGDLVRALASHVGGVIERTAIGGVVKMVIGEARNFPERLFGDRIAAAAAGFGENAARRCSRHRRDRRRREAGTVRRPAYLVMLDSALTIWS